MPAEFNGHRYGQAATHQREWGARLIAELHLRGDERILDVGCGDGVLTASLAAAVPAGSVLGIDASAGMIEAAQAHRGPNLRFRRLDVMVAAFVEEFDVIFSNAALHWILDHEALLAILHHALRPNGALRANFAADGNCATLNAVAQRLMQGAEFRDAFSGFVWPWYMPRLEDYEALIARSPYSAFEVWGESADRFFPNDDAMLAWIDHPAIVPFKQHRGSPLAERFHDAVAEQMIAQTRQPDGTCFETFRRINVMARR